MPVRFRRVHLLVLAGDGTRLARIELSRRLLGAVALVALVGVVGGVAVLVDGLTLGRHAQRPVAVATVAPSASTAATTTNPAAAPAASPAPVSAESSSAGPTARPGVGPATSPSAQLETLRKQLAVMRAEIASWSVLHAGIWRPLGPDAASSRAGTGVGGAIAALAAPVPTSIEAQLNQIVESLAEERQRLQALAKFMAGPGSLLRTMPSHWPLRGAVNSEFGRRVSPWTGDTEFHGGIDISARPGTVVKAPAPGQVSYAGESPGYGTTVILDHGRNIKTLFGHLRDISVNAGDRVERGQVIARSGQTGHTTGPHLHYEIQVHGQPVNPRGFLWE